jgi:hypothetical protein
MKTADSAKSLIQNDARDLSVDEITAVSGAEKNNGTHINFLGIDIWFLPDNKGGMACSGYGTKDQTCTIW